MKQHRNQRLRQEKAEEERQRKKKVTIAAVAAACVVFFFLFTNFIVPAIKYHSAEKLAEAGDYEQAKAAFEKLEDHGDSSDKVLEMRYEMACDLVKKGAYEEAIDALEDLEDQMDVQNKIDEAKYGYVLVHKDYDDYITRAYLDDLKSKNYRNSREIYRDLTKWTADIFAINGERYGDADLMSISNDGTVYFHYTILGGSPGEEISPTTELTYPDGFIGKSKMTASGPSGSDWWCSSNPTDQQHLTPGYLTLTVYDEENQIMGKRSIRITD